MEIPEHRSAEAPDRLRHPADGRARGRSNLGTGPGCIMTKCRAVLRAIQMSSWQIAPWQAFASEPRAATIPASHVGTHTSCGTSVYGSRGLAGFSFPGPYARASGHPDGAPAG